MKRPLFILLLVTLLFSLTPTSVCASPLTEDGPETDTSSIGSVIAALGLYAAMMAVLAVGAEVVIDGVRPIFGLKRKTNAAEAMGKLKGWLPDTLEELGVSATAQEKLNQQIGELEGITVKLEDEADKVNEVLEGQLQEALKDLAVYSVDALVDKHWAMLKPQLEPHLAKVSNVSEEDVRTWLETSLTALKQAKVTELQAHLQSVSTVLDAVREQRNALQGPLLRFWRWLRQSLFELGEYFRGKPDPDHPDRFLGGKWGWFGKYIVSHLLFLPSYLEYAWAWLRRSLPEGDNLRDKLRNLGKHKPFAPLLTIEDAAKRILEEETMQRDQDNLRIVWLRILSAAVGIWLAATLRVDSLQLLEPIMGNAVNTFRAVNDEWHTFGALIRQTGTALDFTRLPGALETIVGWLFNLTPGIVLSGLGAAAGSGFWHDQLDKLRSAKQVVTQVEKMTSGST
jgi:hypothetical protein